MTHSQANLPIHLQLLSACFLMLLLTLFTTPLVARAAGADDVIEGAVLETMNAAGYTYASVSTASGPVWVALPETNITKGDSYSFAPGMEMKDFHSKSLNKTFPSIIFSEGMINDSTPSPHGVQVSSATSQPTDPFAAAVQAEKSGAGQQVQPSVGSGGSMGAVAPFSEISVEKAAGKNSFTVGELFAKASELNGTTVRIRGKVVKYNTNIMGRNWIHLQDGSGDPMQNTHDLVVTTTSEVGSPDIITIEGTLTADKDFGAGYKYVVIVENGTIIK